MQMERRPEVAGSANDRSAFVWPAEGDSRIPDWVYTDETIYEREVERIFHGPTWNFVGLEVEIPNAGDFRRGHVGPTSVIAVRDERGEIHVVQNRCAHRGTEFCRARSGNVPALICPYHQWQYDLAGNLRSIPFRRGIKGKGGMPADFRLEEHGLRKLKVARNHGLIFASFSDDVEPLETYLGAQIQGEIENMFKDRKVKVLGYFRQRWGSNWKLYHENLRDPNHAGLLHVFLSTFGLFRGDMKSAQFVSDCGRHSSGCTTRGGQDQNETTREMRSFKADLSLKDDRIIQFTKDDRGPWSAAIETVWPNFAIQRQSNALAVREIVPHGPDEFFLHWTMFGYEDDSPDMTRHRLRQANLVGPAGMIGVDDSEVLGFVQEGLRDSIPDAAVIELGGKELGTVDHFISEAAIRSMYRHYREVMGL